jgi:MFS superfamily sulfate permease-like transporter
VRFEKQDLVSSLVVFIVAMPLSLGIALASGASPAAGLITAVIGGIVAGMFAGAPLSVTGPAAGMTALVFQLIQQYGLKGLAIITVFAGLMQIIFSVVRAGGLFTLIPKAVLEGVLTAIGAIIVIGQIHVLMGGGIPKSPFTGIATLPQALVAASWAILFCGLLAIAIQLVWKAKMANTKLKWLPGALPAVVGVTLLSLLWEMPRVTLEPLLPLVKQSGAEFFSFEWLAGSAIYWLPALGVAVVASAESLLTARAVDTLVQHKPGVKPARLNQELFAQGAANMISGVVGGLPMTAVMVRSAANVDSGARTRLSTIMHGVWIAAFVGLLPFVIATVPLTALAAVLILTGYKLLNIPHLIHELKTHPRDGFLWLATALLVLATDLLTGLIAAIVLAAVMNYKSILKAARRRTSSVVAATADETGSQSQNRGA